MSCLAGQSYIPAQRDLITTTSAVLINFTCGVSNVSFWRGKKYGAVLPLCCKISLLIPRSWRSDHLHFRGGNYIIQETSSALYCMCCIVPVIRVLVMLEFCDIATHGAGCLPTRDICHQPFRASFTTYTCIRCSTAAVQSTEWVIL